VRWYVSRILTFVLTSSLGLALALGCSADRNSGASGASEAPAANRPPTPADTAGAPAAPPHPAPVKAVEKAVDNAPAPDDEDPQATCVTDCISRNQMRAVSAQQIEDDCRDDCAATD
jgi:hypothetical protein